jgi:hypothetical protein
LYIAKLDKTYYDFAIRKGVLDDILVQYFFVCVLGCFFEMGFALAAG